MKNKKMFLSISVATAMVMSFFVFQSFSASTKVETEPIAIKCKKINDSEVYCKDGSEFKWKCATATSDDC